MTRKGFKYLEIKYKMNLGEELKIIFEHWIASVAI